ncbi:REP-associated tyrosine transposase, partial [Parahaliea mediterranea]
MARPLRIEFAGALYHVTSRGNARQDIFLDDVDRESFLDVLSKACDRYKWLCHAYCLMGNHYHLLLETQAPTLSKGMKYLNGTYTQLINRRHQRVGHVFQGRFKAIVVDRDSYLLELARYFVLNPVRAGMVRSAKDWPWSSYRATAGIVHRHQVLTTDWLLGSFGRRRGSAQEAYMRFVQSGKGQPSPWEALKNQIYLGSDKFVEDMQCKLDPDQSLRDIPRPQKLGSPKP